MSENKDLEQELKNYRKQYGELEQWTKELEEGNKFYKEEIKKMQDWITKLEEDKNALLERVQEKNLMIEKSKTLQERNEELEQDLLRSKNETSKVNYKLNKILANAKVRKIVESKKLDQL